MKKEKWEIEFDKEVENSSEWGGGKFGSLDETWDGENEGVEQFVEWDGIKDFIRKTREEAKEEERERIKEWSERKIEQCENLQKAIPEGEAYYDGKINILRDIIFLINNN